MARAEVAGRAARAGEDRSALDPHGLTFGRAGGWVPVLVGFGISGVEQVAAAGRAGDGVVVGSALMRRVLEGATPLELGAEVAVLRGALDALDEEASADRTAYAEVSGDRR
ncbi:tryptophan synthase subunit alpha [Actinoplanes sp. TRM 88003]|uniref:tryptophan synthase n=2 Tax=Paractinoplanes aksuensis TaxID=2939490 RepID=A0ABT1DKC6_9ACTN|nr:tryptophan synthase subunit alpha [Actinoplanes aksuensis]